MDNENEIKVQSTVTSAAFDPAAYGAVPFFPGRVDPFLEMLGWRHYRVRPAIVVEPETCEPEHKGEIDLGTGFFRIRSTFGVYTLAEYNESSTKTAPARMLFFAPCSKAFENFHTHFNTRDENPQGMAADEAGSHKWSLVAAWNADSRQARIENAIARHEDTRNQDLKEYGYFYRSHPDIVGNDGVIYMIHPERGGLKRIFCLASLGKGALSLRTFESPVLGKRLMKLLRNISLTGIKPVKEEDVFPIIRNDANLRAKAIFEGNDPRMVHGDPYFVADQNKSLKFKNRVKALLIGVILNYGLAIKNFNMVRFKRNVVINTVYFSLMAFLQAGAMSRGLLWRGSLRALQGLAKAAQANMNIQVVDGYRDRDDRTPEFWHKNDMPYIVRGAISRTIDPEKVPFLRPVRFGQTELKHTDMAVGTRIDESFAANMLLDPIQPRGTIFDLYALHGQMLFRALHPNGMVVTNSPMADMSVACAMPEYELDTDEPIPTAVQKILAKMPEGSENFCIDRSLVEDLRTAYFQDPEREKRLYRQHFLSVADVEQKWRMALLRHKKTPEPLLSNMEPHPA